VRDGGPLSLTRLAIEAAFLLLVAAGAGFAGFGAWGIVGAVAAAWVLVAAFEWSLHRRRPPQPPPPPWR
jgi:hypothetical protein